jgi:nicotinate (nicotinamide) nucleotide adenylyltransferase
MNAAARLGLLGGTLDPIHLGHIETALAARTALGLDRVIVLPSRVPPHRAIQPAASGYHRFAMAALAVNGIDGLAASDLELCAPGPSYTADTLTRVQGESGLKAWQLFFITGADAFAEIATWHRYPEVLDLAQFVVVSRPGCSAESLRARLPDLRDRMRTISGSGFRVPGSGFGFRVPGSGFEVSGSGFEVPGSGFQVPGSGFEVPGSGFEVPGSGFEVPGSGFEVPRSGSEVPGSGFEVSGSGSEVSGSGSEVSGSGSEVPGSGLTARETGIFLVSAPTPDVSSTEVRRRIAAGETLRGLVPPSVETHILQHGLYTNLSSISAAVHLHGEN